MTVARLFKLSNGSDKAGALFTSRRPRREAAFRAQPWKCGVLLVRRYPKILPSIGHRGIAVRRGVPRSTMVQNRFPEIEHGVDRSVIPDGHEPNNRPFTSFCFLRNDRLPTDS